MSKNPAYLVSYEQKIKQFYGSAFPTVKGPLVTVVRGNVNRLKIILAVPYGGEDCAI